jgi:hypothetical protein
MTDNTLLRPGDRFPALMVALPGGGARRLPDDLAGHFGVVLFYRGSWCPYCDAQLRAFPAVPGPPHPDRRVAGRAVGGRRSHHPGADRQARPASPANSHRTPPGNGTTTGRAVDVDGVVGQQHPVAPVAAGRAPRCSGTWLAMSGRIPMALAPALGSRDGSNAVLGPGTDSNQRGTPSRSPLAPMAVPRFPGAGDLPVAALGDRSGGGCGADQPPMRSCGSFVYRYSPAPIRRSNCAGWCTGLTKRDRPLGFVGAQRPADMGGPHG